MMLQLDRIYHANAFDLLPLIDDGALDLIVCDGPYGLATERWDKVENIQEFNLNLIKVFAKKLKEGGALYLFGKPDCIDFIDYRPYLTLRSKVVWFQPSRLAQGRINYTNKYDIICYFVKGNRPKTFDLDAIRVPQMVELTHRLRCEQVPSVVNGMFGKTKFNENGKNPGDVWGDIKQLAYKSKELISHNILNTIQKPERLIERLIRASSTRGDVVLDPFIGTGTGPVVCRTLDRRFIGIEKDERMFKLAEARLAALEQDAGNRLFQT